MTSPSSVLRLAGCQWTATGDPADNLATVERMTARAAEGGARLVVHPEAAMVSFAGRLDTVAQPLDGAFADGVRAVAERHGVTVVVGMFTPADEVTTAEGKERSRVHNTLLVTGGGVEETAYRKIHLYDAFGSRESDTVAPGDDLIGFAALTHDLGKALTPAEILPRHLAGRVRRARRSGARGITGADRRRDGVTHRRECDLCNAQIGLWASLALRGKWAS